MDNATPAKASNPESDSAIISQSDSPSVSGNAWSKLQSLLAQLRKAANHPYLFPGAEDPSNNGTTGYDLIEASGKMVVLDRLLQKLKKKGHRVCLFSQYTRTLDILSDYMDYRQYAHCRLDGSTNRVMREVLITQFNKQDSDIFVFMLSTRAGKLNGIMWFIFHKYCNCGICT